MSEEPLFYVGQSGIHQRGVFASTFIPEGTYIVEYIGEKISKEESYRRAIEWEDHARKEDVGVVYIFELNEEFDIDGNNEDNPARLINHSCAENAESVVVEDSIWIQALRDIEKDEEITFDYGYDMQHFFDHPCRCGSENCFGYIVRRDQRKKLKRLLNNKKLSPKQVSENLQVEDEIVESQINS
jgi:SET domain-containing protein